jgi:acyl dehydratase
VVSARRSVSKPHMGVVHCAFVITNQHGEQVLEMEGAFLFGARDTRAAA